MGCASSGAISDDDASDRPDARGSSPSSSAARTARWVTASESHTRGALDVERLGEHVYEGERSAMRASFRAALERYPDASDASAVSASRLARAHPEARGNPLAEQIFAGFSARRDGRLRERDWIAACVVLAPSGSYANKARAGFHAYDVDGDGVVNDEDLRTTLRKTLGGGVSERQVDRLVDQLKTRFDENGDGVLEEHEFRDLLTKEDVKERFTMQLY